MINSVATSPRLALFAPMRAPDVPRIDVRYWVAISSASVFGCNLGDFVSLYLHLGHWLGLFPLAALFLALIVSERRSRWTGEAWYWTVVVVLRTAATNIADLVTHTFNMPYPWVIAAVELLQVLVVMVTLQPLPATDVSVVRKPAANGWYWASLLTAGVLGTAIGDGSAEDLHLGTGCGTLTLSAIALLLVGLGVRSCWGTKAAYWLAIVAVRAAGTTAGDWLAFRAGGSIANGLGLGLPIATTATGAVFVLIISLWPSHNPRLLSASADCAPGPGRSG